MRNCATSMLPANGEPGSLSSMLALARKAPPTTPLKRSRARKTKPASFDRSEEHTSELQSLMRISYAVFCLKKKTKKNTTSPNATKQQTHTENITEQETP